MAGNMSRNIVVANGQVDHVGEVVEVAISRSPVIDDFDNSVKALTDGIGQFSVDEGNVIIEVISQCGGHPAFEDLLRRGTMR